MEPKHVILLIGGPGDGLSYFQWNDGPIPPSISIPLEDYTVPNWQEVALAKPLGRRMTRYVLYREVREYINKENRCVRAEQRLVYRWERLTARTTIRRVRQDPPKPTKRRKRRGKDKG